MLHHRHELFDDLIDSSAWKPPIRWVECQKMYGVDVPWYGKKEYDEWFEVRKSGYWTPLPKSELHKFKKLKHFDLIDWSAPYMNDYKHCVQNGFGSGLGNNRIAIVNMSM